MGKTRRKFLTGCLGAAWIAAEAQTPNSDITIATLRGLGQFSLGLLDGRSTISRTDYSGSAVGAREIFGFNENYRDIVNRRTNIEKEKRDYLIFVIEGVQEIVKAGYPINPRVMTAMAPLETDWGRDPVAQRGNNHFGMKAYAGDPSINNIPTREEINGRDIRIQANFKRFSAPIDSFYDHANMLSTLDHYRGTTRCNSGDGAYIDDLLNETADDSCSNILIPQGSSGSLPYATDRDYKSITLDIIDSWSLDEIYPTS